MNPTTDHELLCRMALTRLMPLASDKQRALIGELGSAAAVHDHRRHLRDILAPQAWRVADALGDIDTVLPRCEAELTYARAHGISVLTLGDAAYPARLAEAPDAPLVLYALGHCDFNVRHVVSIVGTRRCTDYGRELCRHLAADLQRALPSTLVVSGLAYGIDIAAHRACLDSGLPTAAVLAHGLDQIYPRLHRPIAIEMLRTGGLLTEYMSQTRPDKLNFVQRNRIVAAMADATVVVESAARGGSLITASLAFGYSREVFTFPGRTTDAASAGCNQLIRSQRAALVTSAADIISAMQWDADTTTAAAPRQQELFPNLTPDEAALADALRRHSGECALQPLAVALEWPVSRVMATAFTLEMKGVVAPQPGSSYRLRS